MLIKSILKTWNVSIILTLESDGLICVSVNPVMLLSIIRLALTVSYACLRSDLTL